jgi:hypothetical protein
LVATATTNNGVRLLSSRSNCISAGCSSYIRSFD